MGSPQHNLNITKQLLKSPSKFRTKFENVIKDMCDYIAHQYDVWFHYDELSDLILSALRTNDFHCLEVQKNRRYVNFIKIKKWIDNKLIPNLCILRIDEPNIVKLLIFSIEMTYQMFNAGTLATITQKGFRQRRRTFETILVDQFIGKLGEVFVKEFIRAKFHIDIELDWNISRSIEEHKNDIVNAKKYVSIKTTPTLTAAWAEADKNYDYGIMVKCSVPQQPILQFFIEVCGFSRLLDFAHEKIQYDVQGESYIKSIRTRLSEFKCNKFKTKLKGFICGYFQTCEYKPVPEGEELEYLGKVREERYIVSLSELKYSKADWVKFLEDNGLIKKP